MPWDTRLVIITANISAHELANACGETCREAVYRRLIKQTVQTKIGIAWTTRSILHVPHQITM